MFEWDRDKAKRNQAKHGIRFPDTFAVFEDPDAVTIEDSQRGEERFLTIGMDAFGRILVVVYTWRGEKFGLFPHGKPCAMRRGNMKETYDFKGGRRGAVLPAGENKVRITIRLDRDILEWFRTQVEEQGGGNYQTMINQALREHISREDRPLEDVLRRVVREELQNVQTS